MAKQSGPIQFEGTIGMLTGYKMNGQYYLKRKTEISKRRIRTDRAFVNTRRNAAWFALAQKLASQVYREVPLEERNLKIWYPIRNKAQELVRKELNEEEIIRILKQQFTEKSLKEIIPVKREQPAANSVQGKTVNEPLEEIHLGRVVNTGIDRLLMEQLSACRILIKTILQKPVTSTFIRRPKEVKLVLDKFRRR